MTTFPQTQALANPAAQHDALRRGHALNALEELECLVQFVRVAIRLTVAEAVARGGQRDEDEDDEVASPFNVMGPVTRSLVMAMPVARVPHPAEKIEVADAMPMGLLLPPIAGGAEFDDLDPGLTAAMAEPFPAGRSVAVPVGSRYDVERLAAAREVLWGGAGVV